MRKIRVEVAGFVDVTVDGNDDWNDFDIAEKTVNNLFAGTDICNESYVCEMVRKIEATGNMNEV